jgi:hypothetical protein
MLPTVAPEAHLPIAGIFAIWSHATTPNEFPNGPRNELCDGLSWTTATPRTPGVA